jgi:DNA modification methylase
METNTVYCGDCLEVMTKYVPTNMVDLVYVDPPFGSGEEYEIVFKDGVEVRHFADRWIGGKEGYINWIKPRI